MSRPGSGGEAPVAGLAMRDVTELLGVPAPTIRSWERRYGIPRSARSSGGHRRYSDEALHELRLMRDEVAHGARASDAARAVRAMLDPDDPGRARVRELLSASASLDPGRLRAVLDGAHDDLGLVATIDRVLMPAMRQIGSSWESGRCDVAQEHLTTEVARGWLARLTSLAPPPSGGRPVLLACGPRDLHTLGLEALATLLAHDRRASRLLGARTPARSLVVAATATDAAAIVVVSHLPTQRRPAVDALRAAAGLQVPLFYAGNAFVLPAGRVGVPGTYLGDGVGEAAALIARSVPV